MHVVYICREYPPTLRGGGISSYLKQIVISLVVAGCKVTIITASEDTNIESSYIEDGVQVIRLSGGDFVVPEIEGNSKWKKIRPLFRFWNYRKKIRKALLELEDVDIVEVPEYGAESLYLHNVGIPVVVRLHTPALMDHYYFTRIGFSLRNAPFYYPQLQELKEIEKAHYITSCSTSLKEWCEKYTEVGKDKIMVIWNPIDVKLHAETEWNHRGEETNILFAGTICDWKGCGDLAEAGKILRERRGMRNFRISFIGKMGSYADDLKMKYGKEKWFNLVGKVPRNELMEMYNKADVVVFPSWWENMPMVCIEAMLQGAIVIGSTSGGMSEIIEDGVSGWLIEPRDSALLAEKIEMVLKMSSEERESMSIAAQKRIKENFSTEVIVQQTLDYYKYVINDFKNKK